MPRTPRELPVLETPRLRLFVAGAEDAAALLDFHARNREHLAPWMPRPASGFWTLDFWARRLRRQREEYLRDRSMCLALTLRAEGGAQVIGEANFRNIVRGSFHACHLGYHIDAEYQGQGLMGEAIEAGIAHAFDVLSLHRVMANYIPHNARSGALLERLGFTIEGRARDYLFIDGQWRDHVLTSRINPAWEPPSP